MNTRVLFTGLALTATLLPLRADSFEGELFYTRFSGAPNVRKVDVAFDGTSFTVGTPVDVGTTLGADGIVGDPQNSSLLIVGGQGGIINTIDKTTGLATPYPSPASVFHVTVPTSDTILGSGIPGSLARHHVNGDGSIGPGTLISVDRGTRAVTTVIPGPGGSYFFTDAGPGGFGDFGTISFDAAIGSATSATTSLISAGVVSAHGGVYDPFSDSVILFGGSQISQWSTSGVLLGTRTFAAAFDQGTVDGDGHLFVASNTGELLMIDYDADGLAFNPANPTYFKFLDSNLDDIAPLVGPGSSHPVPEPASIFAALALTSLCATRALKRKN